MKKIDCFENFPHTKMGVCSKCGKPIWTTVFNGSGNYPEGMCWACADKEISKGNIVNLIHFDYLKTTPEEQEEYKKWLEEDD